MADNPTTYEDVEARWRPLSQLEVTTVEALLTDAWALLRNGITGLGDRLDAETLDPNLVTMVQSRMVIRAMVYANDRADVDDYTPTNDGAIPLGALYLSDDERAFLDASGSSANAFTIRAYGEPGYATTYVEEPGWATLDG